MRFLAARGNRLDRPAREREWRRAGSYRWGACARWRFGFTGAWFGSWSSAVVGMPGSRRLRSFQVIAEIGPRAARGTRCRSGKSNRISSLIVYRGDRCGSQQARGDAGVRGEFVVSALMTPARPRVVGCGQRPMCRRPRGSAGELAVCPGGRTAARRAFRRPCGQAARR